MDLPRYDDRYVDVGGKRIRYWAEGEGPALVLLHGLAGSVEFWQYNVGSLAGRRRVYALDLPGFGLSDKEVTDVSLESAASFLREFMDALGIEQAALVGNSMGGVLCAQFAVRFPQRTRVLVLVDSAGFGRDLSPFVRAWSLPLVGDVVFRAYQMFFPSLRRLVFRDARSISEEWLQGAARTLREPGVRETTLRIARTLFDAGGQREELLNDLHTSLASLALPTLIVWGDCDVTVPVSHAYRAQKLIPGSEVRIMQGRGHIPQVERPGEFNRLVLDFLASAYPGDSGGR